MKVVLDGIHNDDVIERMRKNTYSFYIWGQAILPMRFLKFCRKIILHVLVFL